MKPTIAAPDISYQTIAAIVRQVTRLKDNFSYHTSFKDLDLTSNQLTRIQTQILANFKRTVQRIEFQDTVATLTERLLKVQTQNIASPQL